MGKLTIILFIIVGCFGSPLPSQTKTQTPVSSEDLSDQETSVAGIIPSHRTVQETDTYTPISARKKMVIARRDSIGFPGLVQSAAYGALDQWRAKDPSYGQGMEGYPKRFGANLADKATAHMLSEGVFPVLLHEDPRYFRKGSGRGNFTTRLGYALSRSVITRTDSGGSTFNFAQLLGASSSIAISRAYHVDYQTAHDAVHALEGRYAFHVLTLVLTEFWPDIKHKVFRPHRR